MSEEEVAAGAGSGVALPDDDIVSDSIELKCRMYANRYPEVDDLVTVQVLRIEEMGAYVSLLEYNDIEGMILLSELSRRRIRSINKLIRVGRQEVVMVLRVDPDKGYIDLSKRRVAPDDLAAHEEKFAKSKAVHSIMRNVAAVMKLRVEDLYQRVAWPPYQKYGHAYDAFKVAVTDPDAIFADYREEGEVIDVLVKQIRRRLTPQPVRIRADFELTCFHYEGVDAIKRALAAGVACGTEENPIKVKLVAPPLYVMSTMSVDKDKGIQTVERALQQVRSVIGEVKGVVSVKMAARAVGEREDKALAKLLEDMDEANREVDGDDEEDEDEDEGMGTAD